MVGKVAAVLVVLALSVSAQAAVLELDLQPTGILLQAGWTEIDPPPGGAAAVAYTVGAYTVTLTPAYDDLGTAGVHEARFANKDRNNKMTDPASPRDNALYDYVRVEVAIDGVVQNTSAALPVAPVMQIDIEGLAPNTAYPVRIGSFDMWNHQHLLVRAAGGTTGAGYGVETYGPTDHPINEMDCSNVGTFTTNGAGLLEIEAAYNHALRDADDDPQAIVNYIEVVPEPMTMSFLALGGLALLRRKR